MSERVTPSPEEGRASIAGDAPGDWSELFKQEWGRLVATAIRMLGDLDRAEEIVAASLLVAVEHWRRDGRPERPGAWLMTTVRNRAIDELRRDRRIRDKQDGIAALAVQEEAAARAEREALLEGDSASAAIPDDRLRLIFTCCHPLLARESRVALTLRLLGGLTTREIARAFLVSEATLSQRIVRAKRTIQERGIPYRVPTPEELPERLPAVLEVIYLVFNEGYAAREGDERVRSSLCDEAIRLATLLAELMDRDPEAWGLLALLEFQASRFATRADAEGELVVLEDQDRERWDRLQIERASRHLSHARELGPLGQYAVQAWIAECHARAPSWEETDWERIVTGYDALVRLTSSPIVELNRCVAFALAKGPEKALPLVDALADEPKLAGYALLPATRADFLRRLGRREEAAEEYRRAIALSTHPQEQRFLGRRLAECEGKEA